jgi:hypothetical protein
MLEIFPRPARHAHDCAKDTKPIRTPQGRASITHRLLRWISEYVAPTCRGIVPLDEQQRNAHCCERMCAVPPAIRPLQRKPEPLITRF